MVSGFLTPLLAGEPGSLSHCPSYELMKPVLEKEVLLATEYANTLNQESLLTAVGCSYFVGHTETALQFDHCWNPTSVIHSPVGLTWLSASSCLRSGLGYQDEVCMCKVDAHMWKYSVYKTCLPARHFHLFNLHG